MAHIRKRFLTASLEKALSFSSIVGILGHRQVGKTTLLEQSSKSYVTFDDEETLNRAKKNAKEFISQFSGIKNGIDECQLAPPMFPALKEHVRKNKKPGQFILSGSVRFTSRHAIRESLTGRIVNLELLPFTISELRHFDLPTVCIEILNTKNLAAVLQTMNHAIHKRRILDAEIDLYYERGGLPGICFIRDNKTRKARILEQLHTILDRDLRQVYPTTLPYSQILDFFRELAKSQGLPIRHSQFERKVRISEVTQKKLLYALESIFLIRRLPIEGGRKGHIVYLEDQAESLLLGEAPKKELINFESFLYRNIRAQFMYSLGLDFRVFHYLSRGEARVPFAFQTENGTLGIIPIMTENPSRSNMATASSFLKKYSDSKIIFINREKNTVCIDDRMAILPAHAVL